MEIKKEFKIAEEFLNIKIQMNLWVESHVKWALYISQEMMSYSF